MATTVRLDDPMYWRERARDVRLTSLAAFDLDSKRILDRIAESYDTLAENAERRGPPRR